MIANSALQTIPLVENDSNDIMRLQRAHGMNAYPVKPVDFDNLVQLVQALGMFWMDFNENPDLPQSRNA